MRRYDNSQGFFDELVTLLAGISTMAVGTGVIQKGRAPEVVPGAGMTLYGRLDIDLQFNPYDVLHPIAEGEWPTTLDVEDTPREVRDSPPATMEKLKGTKRYYSKLISGAFVTYFESHRDAVEGKYGKQTTGWPDVWNFGRIIRNAFSHSGKVHFENPKAAPVSWKTLAYGPSDNGRAILYVDVTVVDIILLMEEMDALLAFP